MKIESMLTCIVSSIAVIVAILAKLLLMLYFYIIHKKHKAIKGHEAKVKNYVNIVEKHASKIEKIHNTVTHKDKIKQAKEKLDKELEELKTIEQRCESLKNTKSFTKDDTLRKVIAEEGKKLVEEYTQHILAKDEESDDDAPEMQLLLKTTTGKVVGKVSPEKVASVSLNKLPPIILTGNNLKEKLLCGIAQLKKEISIEKSNPDMDYDGRRLMLQNYYADITSELAKSIPADNASASDRRLWQELNDMHKQVRTLFDELIDLKRVDMISGVPKPVLQKTPSVDELDLSDKGKLFGKR